MSRLEHKLAAIRAKMADTGVDMLALGPGAHMHWVLDWHPHLDERLTLCVITKTDARFIVPSVNAEQAKVNAGLPCATWRDEDGPEACVMQTVHEMGGAAVVCVDETARTDFSMALLDALPEAERRYSGEIVGALRMIKDAEEFAALKASALLNDEAMKVAFSALKPGLTEREVAEKIKDRFAEGGAAVAFTLCASGPNGAYPHHQTGDRVIEEGDSIVFDIGAALAGWPSDMTRMAAVGRAPEGYEEVHAIVERALVAAHAAAKPGVKAHEIDDAARGVIEQAGYGEYFVHRTGHGLGLEIHEPPFLTSSSQTVLEEGMVFSIEPGIYIPGRFGIRLEEIVILRADGPEILSELPRDLHIQPV
ncbi:Xaa-Pro peptidase family protein [Cognatishimia sp. F0-27]|uniref:M24 family metallopeptidase n=1 Tax=Cognatishimia sp. F0-27 TaxID=2816855 RepID=UPI001D0C4332|nr:M24 family metallopeptidase [Cognatishimia sp. F0-27]MCC1493137.1 M24 family metallopeptidase [Cognatishimia sp. F0-27]